MSVEKRFWEIIAGIQEQIKDCRGYVERSERAIRENEYDKNIKAAKEAFEKDLKKIRTEYTRDIEHLRNTYESSLQTLNRDVETIENFLKSYKPEIPRLTRVGLFRASSAYNKIVLPALLPIIGERSVLVKASGGAKDQAIGALQSIMLRLFLSLPPGKLRFLLIDPVGSGVNMAAFLNIRNDEVKKKLIMGERIWTESNHIEQRLADLSEHMETVIQQYLTNKYPTMEDYNKDVGEVAEAYRLLCIANFPVNFTEASARRLVNIAVNGPKTGVYALIMADTEKELPYDFSLGYLERAVTVIEHTSNGFIWKDDVFGKCTLELDSPPPRDQFNALVEKVGHAAEAALKVEIPFEKIAPRQETWWNATASDGIQVPIGKQGTKPLLFDLGKGTAQHALVVGKTGSGKSTLLHSLIMNLALTYSPDELVLYLIDFKKGVEFRDYAHFQLPHARVVAIQSEREFGLSVLRELDRELQERGDRFRSIGVNNMKEYRDKRPGEKIPRIFFLIDEFQEFFTEDDNLARQVAIILDRLVRQGRALGIHVLLASQSLTLNSANSLSRSTIDQMGVRIALQCSDADSRLILGDDNDAARGLERPGDAIYNNANGAIEGNRRFQVALLTDEQKKDSLQRVQKYVQKVGWSPQRPQIVFDGLELAHLDNNNLLRDAIGSSIWAKVGSPVPAWLGDPIEIKHPTEAILRRQSRSNLLILGQNEEAGVSMLVSAALSLAAQQSPRNIQFYVLDLSNVDSPWHQLFDRLSKMLPHRMELKRRREVPETIQKVEGILKEREGLEGESIADSVYIIIVGLQRARELRSDDAYDRSDLSKQFSTILRDGPDTGIHTLLWCDNYMNLERYLERRDIAFFDLRVALQMSTNDSHKLIDSDAAAKLGPYRALFLDEDKTGQLEKFRPYNFPTEDVLHEICSGLQLKARRVQ